ncbi:metal cation transporter, ZIP family [Opisthorchis viverrini]|uniref:Metal cation transporter, ZIP family n=2 Tax=Opisthorchis viverrini TaxID=6198 RepID=A0A1S8X7G0_OPIVI|nr:hypothetical protein T265_06678 [Opisthorchis viverrini]KER25985.1 hypothetical protein T265_06678 [Opisthorchis viverrini]OON22644.1 metal cation transporter, ZIP family [Opisthorchis viverrini]
MAFSFSVHPGILHPLKMSHAPVLLFLLCALTVSSHEDHNEPPHFKYSREANTPLPKPAGARILKHSLRSESAQQLWLETSSAVLLISVAPFLSLVILPDLNKYHGLLKVLLAFAAGGLLGDAFLHLIPHAIDNGHTHDDHDHTHDATGKSHDHTRHMMVGLSVVAGIFVFLCIEKSIRLIQHGHAGHSHSVSVPEQQSHISAETNNGKSKKNKKAGGDEALQKREKKNKTHGPASEFKVTGYLNLAADFTHNFTDGLAVGASFLISRNVGMVTTLTVLLHELPHEIGDYAILIRSGCSARKAMFLQLFTAIGAALGSFLSLAAAGVGMDQVGVKFDVPLLTEDLITTYLLPFTAGGFIYIAMTSVLPDLLSPDEIASKRSSGFLARMTQSIIEVFAVVGGIAMMAGLGAMEQ